MSEFHRIDLGEAIFAAILLRINRVGTSGIQPLHSAFACSGPTRFQFALGTLGAVQSIFGMGRLMWALLVRGRCDKAY